MRILDFMQNCPKCKFGNYQVVKIRLMPMGVYFDCFCPVCKHIFDYNVGKFE